ncbi:DUF6455 family protein [Primorskyibacter sp. S187A]|uniref:DUF6455 family protein n=1 Tax=Primorskyibacter sp. S187A TaxID=3415130 RepID=UPI003C7E3886
MARDPQHLGDPNTHYWLVQRMLHETGADAVSAFDAGALDNAQWSEIVATCRTCQDVGKCKKWLSALEAEHRSAPDYCLNKRTFAQLPQTECEES